MVREMQRLNCIAVLFFSVLNRQRGTSELKPWDGGGRKWDVKLEEVVCLSVCSLKQVSFENTQVKFQVASIKDASKHVS